jgi:hypothetical protein
MTVVVLGGVSLMIRMSGENRRYSTEQQRWAVLAVSGLWAEGVIRSFRMHSSNMTRGGSYGQTVCSATLDVEYSDSEGMPRTVAIDTYIEDVLIPQFLEPLKKVHLRYDLEKPAAVCIDRQLTPLEVPRAANHPA